MTFQNFLIASSFWQLATCILLLSFCIAPISCEILDHIDGFRNGVGAGRQQVLIKSPHRPLREGPKLQAGEGAPLVQADQKANTLNAMIEALDVMQDRYFETWLGIWPTAIDWTSAVMGTFVSAALSTLSTSADYVVTPGVTLSSTEFANENLINHYFSQLTAYYFGQDSFSLRNEAYDDMLWVVLGWLESIKFIKQHSSRHYSIQKSSGDESSNKFSSWYGEDWIPGFAHRARIFWDLASQGWDTSLCGGGMIWSPYLGPYKNAITNELFITASISMYLYFPGDENLSPFANNGADGHSFGKHEAKHLKAAIEGYKWLMDSNMTDSQGLYVDGFHISGWDESKRRNHSNFHGKCDVRNEMVYTYNQGVLLSGQRGLWEATGARSYLEDGHELISSVIRATGYDLKHNRVFPEPKGDNSSHERLGEWRGIGRSGILEDFCDSHGYCSQDGQTFKGIFFHHLSLFCAPLPPNFIQPGEIFDPQEYHALEVWHDSACIQYGGWIKRNAEAAMSTQDDEGKYGMWWGAPTGKSPWNNHFDPDVSRSDGAIDYRNLGVPKDRTWRKSEAKSKVETQGSPAGALDGKPRKRSKQHSRAQGPTDPNDRERGRTVETQGGGLAVLRALWEIVDMRVGKENT